MSGQRPIHPDDEERVAADMSREIESLAFESGVHPPVAFADRVMAAIAAEPLPQPVRAFGVALVGGRLHAAAASVGDAWRVVGGGSTPFAVRAQSLALVLVLTIGSLAVAGGATVGAIDLLTANPPPAPEPTKPLPSDPRPSPSSSPSVGPDMSPDASPTAEPTGTPEPTETPEATERPAAATPRATATDDHGGGSGSGGSGSGGSGSGGSGSGSGSGGDHQTPTPMPTESDDHGGSDG